MTVAPPSKGERTRLRLLEVAVQRFAASGFRRTSVADIAREAGVTPAATYAYFPNKDALFRAAVDHDAAALIEAVRPERGSGETLAARWRDIPTELMCELPNHPLARRVLSAQEPEVIPQLLELPSLAEIRSELAADIRAGQDAGTARRDVDADQLALGLETIVLSFLMTAVHVPPDAAPERGDALVAVLDAALRA